MRLRARAAASPAVGGVDIHLGGHARSPRTFDYGDSSVCKFPRSVRTVAALAQRREAPIRGFGIEVLALHLRSAA